MNIEQYVANKKYLVGTSFALAFEKEELRYQAYFYACMFENDVNVLKIIIRKHFIDVYKPVMIGMLLSLHVLVTKMLILLNF